MEQFIAILGDLCVIIFDLLLYSRMTVLRKDSVKRRILMYAGCCAIVVIYILGVYVYALPVSASALLFMTLPSMALFWAFSKYRDARFFLTFCFVDTISLIIGFISRCTGLLLGHGGSIAAIVVMLLAFAVIYRLASPYLATYRNLLDCIDDGWLILTVSAALIYITMIFLAIYPEPLINRMEYCLPYLALSVMVLSFYTVFITNIIKSKRVYDQSMQLKDKQKWYRLAYIDALTGIPNRMAYMERIHDLERTRENLSAAAVAVFDLDGFKSINDTWGHRRGDDILKQAAELLTHTFCEKNDAVYRIGGDEFAAISVETDAAQLQRKLDQLKSAGKTRMPFSLSSGFAFVNPSEENAMEQAFSRADMMMYQSKKACRCKS